MPAGASSYPAPRCGVLPATIGGIDREMACLRRSPAQEVEKITPEFVLVDGREKIPHLKIPQMPIIKGDSKSQSIAAASIIAKVTRDKIMQTLHQQFPEFGFDRHKGYGTKKHKEALKKFGPTPWHRLGYAPVKLSYLKTKEYRLGL